MTLPQYIKESGYHADSIVNVYHVGHNTYNDQTIHCVPYHPERPEIVRELLAILDQQPEDRHARPESRRKQTP